MLDKVLASVSSDFTDAKQQYIFLIGVFDMIGNAWEWTETPADNDAFVIKGGSFLCANNFCRRYRPAARERQDSDFSTNHIGIRLVRDIAQRG